MVAASPRLLARQHPVTQRRTHDAIAFPKTAKGTCLMTDSPSTVEPKQLRDLHIELKVAKKE